MPGLGGKRPWESQLNMYCLLVWLPFFIFPYVGLLIIPTDSYFSEGLKPPTSVKNEICAGYQRLAVKCGHQSYDGHGIHGASPQDRQFPCSCKGLGHGVGELVIMTGYNCYVCIFTYIYIICIYIYIPIHLLKKKQ